MPKEGYPSAFDSVNSYCKQYKMTLYTAHKCHLGHGRSAQPGKEKTRPDKPAVAHKKVWTKNGPFEFLFDLAELSESHGHDKPDHLGTMTFYFSRQGRRGGLGNALGFRHSNVLKNIGMTFQRSTNIILFQLSCPVGHIRTIRTNIISAIAIWSGGGGFRGRARSG